YLQEIDTGLHPAIVGPLVATSRNTQPPDPFGETLASEQFAPAQSSTASCRGTCSARQRLARLATYVNQKKHFSRIRLPFDCRSSFLEISLHSYRPGIVQTDGINR